MSKKTTPEKAGSVTVTIDRKTYVRLDALRRKKAEGLGLDKISWNEYLSLVARELEGATAAAPPK